MASGIRILSLRLPLRLLPASLALSLAACSGPRWRQELLTSDSGIAVYVERKVDKEKVLPQGFLHPATVDPALLARLLEGLRWTHSGILQPHARVEPIFNAEEARKLAPALSEGLRKASPDERVRILAVRTAPSPLSLGLPATSAVAFFRENGRMDLAFDRIQEAISQEDADPRAVAFPDDPVEILGSTPDLLPLAGAGVRGSAPRGKIYPRWLVVDLKAFGEGNPVIPAAPAPSLASAGAASTPSPAAAAAAPPPSAGDPELELLRKKLRNLDQLLKDGAITQEEHDKIRLRILEQSER